MNKIQPTHVSSKESFRSTFFNYMEAKYKCLATLQLFDRSVGKYAILFECYL